MAALLETGGRRLNVAWDHGGGGAADGVEERLRPESVEARHRDHEGEAVGEGHVERLGAGVGGGGGVRVVGGGRVHGGPAVAELPEGDALDHPLVDHGEELVLEVGPAARHLVEEHGLASQMVAGVWRYSRVRPFGTGKPTRSSKLRIDAL